MSLYPLSRPCPKCGAKLGELCGNTPAHPCDERWGDLIDGDKLRALADALGQVPDDTPDAAYFGLDMTHGQARGNLAAILAMAEENTGLREDVTRQMAAANSEANRAEELLAENRRLREALTSAAYRLDLAAAEIVDNRCAFVVTGWAREARQALAAPGDGR